MSAAPLEGVIAASITPLAEDLSIDVNRLARHTQRLLDNGCSFVSTFGTTGEGASLSTIEKLDALRSLSAAGADMSRQVPGVMTPTLDDAATMLVGIANAGCRAALVLPPFYYGTSEAGVAGWYDALIERTESATQIDLLLYNIPQMSRIRFTRELVETIVKRHGSRIVGIKDSTGDVQNGVMLAKSFPDLAVFTGDDRVLPTLLASGGAGMIGGMPNVFARDLRRLYDDRTNAEILAKQTERILAVDRHGSLVALKAALATYLGDENYARVLPPLKALDEVGRGKLLESFAKSGFDAAA
ncbi:dihydrodipicolinate synthase family protein [Devosia sp. RR2S18]|uniref:dihydrodipicolinate synthase family protein n=1 Tax=Devosia rhizosphaerae TaxID=3049774 RepID=UPI00254247D7|nr:dihydrodipicolinate synthase family protein [Devosia sp. RR2S18]WIJ26393.1 dihydrodipicolinate synthase family protein [Devosia sp. RR2S18]